MKLEPGQVFVNFQYNSAKGADNALVYNPQKDFLMRGRHFSYVITVADEATYNWVAARAHAIHANFLAQEDTTLEQCERSVLGFTASQRLAAAERGEYLLGMDSEFQTIRTAPMPKEALESPVVLSGRMNIRGASMNEKFVDLEGNVVESRHYKLGTTA